jgi:hypothetical protein
MILLLALSGCFIQVHVFDEECSFDEAATRVAANLGSGDLVIGSGQALTAARHVEYSGDEQEEPGGEATLVDGLLTLPDACDDGRLYCTVTWTVTLPAGADLDLRTGSGNIEVRDIAGDGVLETGSGDVVVASGSGASLWAQTGSGDIDMGGDYPTLDLETGSGDLVVDAGDSTADVSLSTGSGDVDARVPSGGWDLQVSTGSGDVDIEGVQDDGSSARLLRVDTGSGDVTLRDRKSTRLNSSHNPASRMPSSA